MSGGIAFAGTAYVFSGATGNILFRSDGESTWIGHGFSVSSAGDVNGDGLDDVQGAFGYLNNNAQAAATLTAGPALAVVIGQTIYFAAVTYDVAPLTGRMSSIVRYLQIVP